MGNLLFGPNGRISPADFMKGSLVLIIISFILGLLPLISMSLSMIFGILGLALIYCWVCLFMKRMRDGGKSGWMCLVPILAFIVASFISGMIVSAIMVGGMAGNEEALAAAAESGDISAVMDAAQGMAKKTAIPSAILGAVVSYLIAFVTNKVVGHDANDNQYGPETH